jgi:hypothetical protein
VHGLHLLAVPQDYVSLDWQFSLCGHEIGHISHCGIGRGVIYEDDVVVGILLHEDGVHIVNVSVISGVIEGWDDYAEGQLSVLANPISLFIIGSLCVNDGICDEKGIEFKLHPADGVINLLHVDPCVILIVHPISSALKGYRGDLCLFHVLPILIVQ